MSEASMPKSIASSTLNICGVDLVVHVLDDGQRVIESEGLAALFDAWEHGITPTEEESMKLARAVRP